MDYPLYHVIIDLDQLKQKQLHVSGSALVDSLIVIKLCIEIINLVRFGGTFNTNRNTFRANNRKLFDLAHKFHACLALFNSKLGKYILAGNFPLIRKYQYYARLD